jgi:hypothetical protein
MREPLTWRRFQRFTIVGANLGKTVGLGNRENSAG